MAVKCNIASLALKYLYSKQWGVSTEGESVSILENYLEYLKCQSVEVISSNDYTKECDKINQENGSLVEHKCNMNISGISFQLAEGNNPEDILFYLAIGDVYGAEQPLTYKWTYDSSDFDLVGADNEPNIKLKMKAGKVVDLVVSTIAVEIVDAAGCKDIKTCYYTPTGMKCHTSFKPCFNANNLRVSYNYVSCKRIKNLAVRYNLVEVVEEEPVPTMMTYLFVRYNGSTGSLTNTPPLAEGRFIVSINGVDVVDVTDFVSGSLSCNVGDTVRVRVMSSGTNHRNALINTGDYGDVYGDDITWEDIDYTFQATAEPTDGYSYFLDCYISTPSA